MENSGKLLPEVSVIMPCLNEEQGVGICIEKCFKAFINNGINGEVIIVDNGSTDGSKEIIIKSGARLVEEKKRGYGSAYLRGFSEARGKYLIMGDSDDTYDFLDIKKFIDPLKNNYDFVIGTRLRGKIKGGEGTMPWLHRFVGNPFLTLILRNLFKVKVSDVYCGMRSMTREAYEKLHLRATGMEYALEMVINTRRASLKIKEVSIDYGLRRGESKLRTFKDGWRSLRFMMLYSPKFIFLVPGSVLFFLGFLIILSLVNGPVKIHNLLFDYHFMFLGSIMALTGYQIINLGFFSKIYAYSEKFDDEKRDKLVQFLFKNINLERIILVGFGIFLVGILILGYIILKWYQSNFGSLFEVRKMILSLTLVIIGLQTIFNGFFYSMLRIEKK